MTAEWKGPTLVVVLGRVGGGGGGEVPTSRRRSFMKKFLLHSAMSYRNRTANRMRVTNGTRLLRACSVVIFTNINVLWSFTKRSV